MLFPIPFIMFVLLFSLTPSHNSDPGSQSRLFSPLPTTVRALHFFIARRFKLFLPSSTSVASKEKCIPRVPSMFICTPITRYTYKLHRDFDYIPPDVPSPSELSRILLTRRKRKRQKKRAYLGRPQSQKVTFGNSC